VGNRTWEKADDDVFACDLRGLMGLGDGPAALQDSALAGISDLFAVVAGTPDDIPG
jgi:hypothetical protein